MDKIKNAVGKLVFQFPNGIFNFILHSQFQHDFNLLHAPNLRSGVIKKYPEM